MSNIVLIGFKACGKTSLGQQLALLHGCEWIDTDRELEAQYAQDSGQFLTCREIYRTIGAERFRDLEKRVLATVKITQPTVISTGGGVILQAENRLRLKEMGTVVYLCTPYAILLQRLKAGPALTVMSSDLDTEFASMFAEREPLYRMCADTIIDTAQRTIEEMVREPVFTALRHL